MRGGGGFRGGGGGFSRSAARPSVTSRPMASRPAASAAPAFRSPGGGGGIPSSGIGASRPGIGNAGSIGNAGNRTGDRVNIGNGNRPINIGDNDIAIGGRPGYPGYGYHPVARGALWGAAAATTAAWTSAAIGSYIYSLPPDCVISTVNGVTYQHCGDAWYQPQFVGDDTAYLVVAPPQ